MKDNSGYEFRLAEIRKKLEKEPNREILLNFLANEGEMCRDEIRANPDVDPRRIVFKYMPEIPEALQAIWLKLLIHLHPVEFKLIITKAEANERRIAEKNKKTTDKK